MSERIRAQFVHSLLSHQSYVDASQLKGNNQKREFLCRQT